MNAATHSQLASFIWSICNLLRGPYKRNEYRKVILPLTVLRRFDCLLAPTKEKALAAYAKNQGKSETIVNHVVCAVTGYPFYNHHKLDFAKLRDDPNHLVHHLNEYLSAFSPNVRVIMEKFKFDEQIAHMASKNILYEVIKKFAALDLSSEHIDNMQMGYVFEELIRIGAEQANEEAGEHFTPREVIKLMVDLLFNPGQDMRDLLKSGIVVKIYDPACGTGGMLSEAEKRIRSLNDEARPILFGQDWNDEAWAVCRADMLIKGADAENIKLGDTFINDAYNRDDGDKKHTFDYMLANPPFGVEWKQQQKFIENERDTLGLDGRFHAGLPRINDGALLFLQHMLSKVNRENDRSSRIAIVFNGSPLFTGDAGSGESEIRRWIIEHDGLEAVVALPDQLFYNTGIGTYIWIVTNRKEKRRTGKVQLIDARNFYIKMKKSLGNKRNKIGDASEGEPDQIGEIVRIHGNFQDGETREFVIPAQAGNQTKKSLVVSRIFDNADFGYHKITVERPQRDEQGNIVIASKGKNKGNPEPDAELRDTENVPLKENIEDYFQREVLPHVPDAWIDHSKTKVGYEIPLNRHFYRYEAPRELGVIEDEIKVLEEDIMRMLAEVTA